MIIAIDGPAGTGKGTISKLIAERLGFMYIDTGAMYRAITLKILRNNIKINDIKEIEELLNNTKIDFENLQLDSQQNNQNKTIQRVYLDNEDVTDLIRMPEVNENVSAYSAIKIIRTKMVELQRKIANGKNVIMEGRDITTVVFPNAEIKVYLTASAEERARRRYIELKERGINTTYEETLESINKRDYNDMNKEIGALKVAPEAIVIDSTDLSIEETYEKMNQIIQEKSR